MSVWKEEHVELLRKLWKDGFSGQAIADRLGGTFSRNAVIGKVHRLGLSGRPTTSRMMAAYARRGKRPKKLPRPTGLRPVYKFGSPDLQADDRKPVPVFVTPQAERKSLLDLEANDCRFPFGDGPFEFCGRRKVDGLSYCGEHALSCFQPVRLREPSTTPFPQATPPSITTAAVLEDV